MPSHVRKGDTVMITSGNARGMTGVISRVIPEKDQVIVQNVNLHTKHIRPTQTNPQGGTVQREAPIHISNVSPVVDGEPTRVRFRINADGSKERIAARTGRSLGRISPAKESRAAASQAGAATARSEKTSSKKTSSKKSTSKKTGARKSASKKKTSKKTGVKKTGSKKTAAGEKRRSSAGGGSTRQSEA